MTPKGHKGEKKAEEPMTGSKEDPKGNTQAAQPEVPEKTEYTETEMPKEMEDDEQEECERLSDVVLRLEGQTGIGKEKPSKTKGMPKLKVKVSELRDSKSRKMASGSPNKGLLGKWSEKAKDALRTVPPAKRKQANDVRSKSQ